MKLDKLQSCLACNKIIDKSHIYISNLGVPGMGTTLTTKFICCDDPKIVELDENNNNLLLLDSDSIIYIFAYRYKAYYDKNILLQKEELPSELILEQLEKDINSYINYILSSTNSRYYLGLLGESKSAVLLEGELDTCFRYGVCKTFNYKSKRTSQEYVSFWKPYIYNILIDKLKFVEVVRSIEVDDMLAILNNTKLKDDYKIIIAGQDKDLLQIPTTHFNYVKGEFINANEESDLILTKSKLTGYGYKLLYAQCITGDTADNIPGIKSLGPVAAYKALHSCQTEEEAKKIVIDLYLSKNLTEEDFNDNYIALKLIESSDVPYLSDVNKLSINTNIDLIMNSVVDIFDKLKK